MAEEKTVKFINDGKSGAITDVKECEISDRYCDSCAFGTMFYICECDGWGKQWIMIEPKKS